ncbi:terminase large subunit [Clostridium sp.]|uniref:terminase large subunit n=1 Tax=Clostridium sp. TaxID=1506 RepID=UPI00399278AC
MTILDELIQYANNCLEDKFVSEYEDYISCQKHKWSCKRFLNDLERIENDDNFNYYWNEEEAQKIVNWFSYLRHSKGTLANKPIILNVWQKFCLCQIYGWRHKETNYKRFNQSFIEVARKNAKSQMESGVVLFEIATQSTKNNELYEAYCAGTKREQSKIIFDECILMLKGSPLKSKFKITRDRITHIKTGSYLKALCKEDGKKGDGTNPAILVLDEYHQHETTEFYDLGYGANTKESLLMIITTAGVDLTFPCYTQEYEYCTNILNPNVDVNNDNYFVDILEIDKKEEVSNIRSWKKANPIRMTYAEGVDKIQKAYEIARQIPEKMPGFLTKCLNLWVQAKKNGYMNMEKWKFCEVKEVPINTENMAVWVGFDMSAKIDLTSVAFIIPYLDEGIKKYIVQTHSFIPNRERLQERTLKDKVPYEAWELSGYLSLTNTQIIDQKVVWEYVKKIVEENNWIIEGLCFDENNASQMMLDLEAEGYRVYDVTQSHRSLNEATCSFREQVYEGNVVYTKNSLLNFAMSNAVVTTSNQKIKVDKDATKFKIDPVDAILVAYKLAMYFDVETTFDVDNWLNEDW